MLVEIARSTERRAMMRPEEAIEILKKESCCMHATENECKQYALSCSGCPYSYPNTEERLLEAIDKAVEIMEGKNDE